MMISDRHFPSLRTIGLFLWLVVYLGGPLFLQGADLRDSESLYVDRLPGMEAPVLSIKKTTAVYASRSLNGHLRNFVAGDSVLLVAYHPDAYLVRHRASGFEGWVASDAVEGITNEFLESARALEKEAKRYQQAIEKEEVIAGMDFDQVVKAIGDPDEKAFRSDADGRVDLWTYIEYRTAYETISYRDPATGQLSLRRMRRKVPDTRLTVEFTSGRVTAVEKATVQ